MVGNCAICRRYTHLEKHHVFPGPFRKKSEKYKAYIFICHACHTGKYGVQYNRSLSDQIKATYQKQIMHQYGWTKERFIQEFGKNYIKEENQC